MYLIFSEHPLFTLVREHQHFLPILVRKPLSSTCCGEEPFFFLFSFDGKASMMKEKEKGRSGRK
ncbi:hypothetical protein I656_00079 [Geobacillus sp. WSUCF1]|nr:hypothetical protein I656_00079 [Geobacillus sp. WSUCF1]